MILFWHRRDLRIADNAGLFRALKMGGRVQPIFIFDKTILEDLPEQDQRVLFIYQEVLRLKKEYQALGSDLVIFYDHPLQVFQSLVSSTEFNFHAVVTNRDYEPYAQQRDQSIFELLKQHQIDFFGAKDHVIFEKDEILKDDGEPYKVYTPYSKKWKAKLSDFYLKEYPVEKYTNNLVQLTNSFELISLEEMGFQSEKQVEFPSRKLVGEVLKNYHNQRDIPAIKGTSRLSLHLRFGTISIRELVQRAKANEKYLNELIWREFYQMILYHFPHTVDKSFKSEYDAVKWENNEEDFKKWCAGKTGYPIVDAGMRELNQTGFMHNRVRMIVASFLTKHLLIDWRWGEAYFAEKLLDFELASNVGGWQWAASCGVDAQPYFRVFNPITQQERFDPDFNYIKKWVPEYGTSNYPEPIVEHKMARGRAIERFRDVRL
jgi:deoxyribodipyrimidine photo-lyase